LRRSAVQLGLLAGLWMPPQFSAQAAEQPSEYQVKAAFLLNFTKFIEWPPGTFSEERSPLTICILGPDPFGSALDQIVEGEAVNGRMVAVQRIGQAPPSKTCQVLFVARPEKEVPKLLDGVGLGVLTVGNGDKFLQDGGMVAFVVEDRHVRFDINQKAAVDAMLAVSSRLLNVARSVRK
jgi:hypothetical protein